MTRGEVYWADLGLPLGSEVGFRRPVIIIQSDSFNQSKINTTIIVPLTTNMFLAEAPGNVMIPKKDSRLGKDSVANISLITAIDKARILEKTAKLPGILIREIERGIRLTLGIKNR